MNLMDISSLKAGANRLLARVEKPLVLKIGVDTGRTLLTFAKKYPDRFFVGVEIKSDKASRAAARLAYHKCQNAVVINMEAYSYISRFAENESFQELMIFFPTPIPSSLRALGYPVAGRLVNANFEKEAHRILIASGCFRILTDHVEYYNEVQSTFSAARWWPIEWQKIAVSDSDDCLVGTPCEKGFRAEGKKIYSIQLIKKE